MRGDLGFLHTLLQANRNPWTKLESLRRVTKVAQGVLEGLQMTSNATSNPSERGEAMHAHRDLTLLETSSSAPRAGNLVGGPMTRPKQEANRGTRAKVLVAEDENDARCVLREFLVSEGYEVQTAENGRAALGVMDRFSPDIVLTDLQMPVLDGFSLIEQGRRLAPHAAFVVMTGHASIPSAVQAVKKGADNYLTKPLDLDEVSAIVARLLEKVELFKESARLREHIAEEADLGRILGNHPSMQTLLKQVVQVAPSGASVVIHGESGTGKELIASAIHHNSSRRDKPFVRLNCAALAPTLLESELFGHERGAYTGALGRREGRFAQANGGTLFLDEISEIPEGTQVKLLRFLQEHEFEPVGSNQTRRVDVRIVAATNRDLADQIRAGRFREDLFYRLKVVSLEVPPLRARRSDIPLLASTFLRQSAHRNERQVRGFAREALGLLLEYPWPGNVRELENAIERAVVMSRQELLQAGDFELAAGTPGSDDLDVLVPGIPMVEVERIVMLKTLEAVGGSTGKAASILGISRRKIQYKLKEWGLTSQEMVRADQRLLDGGIGSSRHAIPRDRQGN